MPSVNPSRVEFVARGLDALVTDQRCPNNLMPCLQVGNIDLCEGGGDVVGVVTPFVRGVLQVLQDDQVVELRVQLAVQEVEGKKEDREGQVEVEEEKRLKEKRT